MKRKIRTISENPYVCIIDDFLSDQECDSLIAYAKKKGLKDSKVAYSKKVNTKLRASRQRFLGLGETALIRKIENRVDRFTKTPRSHGENLQVVHYEKGGFFRPHIDLGNPNDVMGSRMITVLIYLSDVEEGGMTVFPYIGVGVIPQKGRALVFYNVKNMQLPPPNQKKCIQIPDECFGNKRSLHGGEPIVKGEKWIVTRWVHSIKYRDALQKTLPDPMRLNNFLRKGSE